MDAEALPQIGLWASSSTSASSPADGASTSQQGASSRALPATNDSQPEPAEETECWQLSRLQGQTPTRGASQRSSNMADVASSSAAGSLRTRPTTTTAQSAPTKTFAAGKLLRKPKSRKKRLTMTKGTGFAKRMAIKTAAPATAPHSSIPIAVLSDDERHQRMTTLLENCPQELAAGLRDANAVVLKMQEEADVYRETVRTRVKTGQSLDDLSAMLVEQGKARQIALDANDVKLTSHICDSFSAVHLTEDRAEDRGQSIFSSGLSDVKVNLLRSLVGLPPFTPTMTNALIKSDNSVSQNGHSLNGASSHQATVDIKNEPTEENAGPTTTRRVCDFTNRPHPKDLSQQLYSLLGRQAQPKADRRAIQRAKRVAQIENLTEERIHQVVSDYVAMCQARPVEDVSAVRQAAYHRVHANATDTPDAIDAGIQEFHEHFVKSCLCKGHNKCEACRGLPASKRTLPVVSNVTVPAHALVYAFCDRCRLAYPSDTVPARLLHPEHSVEAGPALPLERVRMWEECCSMEEEQALVRMLNKRTWSAGQAGVFRQDYGPVVDYARQQVTLEASSGLPQFIEYEVIKIRRRKDDQDHPKAGAFECASFSAIELAPERTSAIQPRVEDDWIWGNELIFMSLMADVTLTLSPVAWDGAETYRVVRIRIPRRSQVSVSGLARRQWNYSVLSSDVHERQMLLVFRELSGLFRGTTGRVEQAEMGRRIAAANAAFKGDVNSCDCGE